MEHLDLKITTTGNSLAIIIPKEGRDRLKLRAGDLVRVRFQKMKLVPQEEETSGLRRNLPSGLIGRSAASLKSKVSGGAPLAFA